MRFDKKDIPIDGFDLIAETTEKGRVYITPTGDRYPSITTVLGYQSKDSLEEWKNRVGKQEANKISKRATNKGTAVHDLLEKYIDGEGFKPAFPHIQVAFNNIKRILDDRLNCVYTQETPLYSSKLRIAGRVDLIGEFDGKPTIIDFKTSNREKKKEWIISYFQQCTAYSIMFEERTGIAIPNIAIIMDIGQGNAIVFKEKIDNWKDELIKIVENYHATQI